MCFPRLGIAEGRLPSVLPRLATGANLTGLMLSAGQRANITVRAQAGAGFVPLSEGPFKVEVTQLFGCALGWDGSVLCCTSYANSVCVT